MPDVANDDGVFQDNRAWEVAEATPPSGGSSSGRFTVAADSATNIVAEEAPRNRRAATPYDLKLEVLGEEITNVRRNNNHREEMANHLYALAEEFIEVLEKRERWTHFYSQVEMPCPEFLIPGIETDVED